MVANNTNEFDQDFFNTENLEWACMILDSRLMYINYEAFLIPMLDFANYQEDEENPTRTFRPKFDEGYSKTDIKTQGNYAKDKQVFENIGYSGDNYLLYHGISLPNNGHDCYSTSLTFSEKQEDNLREYRKAFFARYFLFDKNDIDQM
jgi:hypothetical protein